MLQKIIALWHVIKDAGLGFDRHNVLKLSAALGFYAILTLGPMLLVIIFISNLFWGRQAIEGTIHSQISGLIGNEAAIVIQELIKNAAVSGNSLTAIIGFGTLLFTATTFFTEMQDSINIIWNLRVKKSRSWQQILKNRLICFCILSGLGLLVIVFLLINGVIEGFMGKIQEMFPQIAITVVYIVNLLLNLLVVALLFAFIFKVLPDAVIQWRDVAAGAFFTALLFMIGKFGVTFYINVSNMGSTYSSAGSLIVLLFWIFYSSTVLYYGAEFTKAYALKFGGEIIPKEFAVTIRVIEVESNEHSVQQNEKSAEPEKEEIKKALDHNKKIVVIK